MYGYHTHFKSYTESKHGSDPDGYGHGSETDWIVSNKLTSASWEHCPEIVSNFELQPGKTYYLVYVIYSTGDSFGEDVRSNCEFVSVFLTKERADTLRTRIIRRLSDSPLEHSFIFPDANGQTIHIPEPWRGHFETVNEVGVIPVQLEAS